MCDNEKEEAANLKEEFEWVLREEVHAILHQLHSVLVECAHRFPVPLYGNEGQKQDKFILTSQPEQLKCIVTLTGDSITHAVIREAMNLGIARAKKGLMTNDKMQKIAFVKSGSKKTPTKPYSILGTAPDGTLLMDTYEKHYRVPEDLAVTSRRPDIFLYSRQLKHVILVELTVPWEVNIPQDHNVKLNKYHEIYMDISFKVLRQMHTICRTSINQDGPWKLQQIQDAANHLQQAIGYIDNVDKHYVFRSSDEVLHIIQCLLGSLQRARTALVLPKKKAIDELMKSRNMKALAPNLPEDLAISFYIQSHKLIFVAYQLSSVHGTMRIDSCQADCAVPWLSDVLFMLTASLHMCQQLKDKLCVFSQYKDFTVGSRSVSMVLN